MEINIFLRILLRTGRTFAFAALFFVTACAMQGPDAPLVTEANTLAARYARLGIEIINAEAEINDAVRRCGGNIKKINGAQRVQFFGERQGYVDSVLYLYRKEVAAIEKSGGKLDAVYDKYLESRKKLNTFILEIENNKHPKETAMKVLDGFSNREKNLNTDYTRFASDFRKHVEPHNRLLDLLNFEYANLNAERLTTD